MEPIALKRSSTRLSPWPLLVLALLGCEVDEASDPEMSLVTPIALTVSGRVVADADGTPLAGMTLVVQRVALGSGNDAAIERDPREEVTGSDGRFSFELAELDVIHESYVLEVADPGERYAPNASHRIYALQSGELDLGDIRLHERSLVPRVRLRGQVREAQRSARPIENAEVQLRRADDGTLEHTVRTDALGEFLIDEVEVRQYEMRVDGALGRVAGARAQFAPHTRELALQQAATASDEDGAPLVQLDATYLLTEVDGNELRFVLSWTPQGQFVCNDEGDDDAPVADLDGMLVFPPADCDVNHLVGQQVELEDPGISIAPASGFLRGTCYWPSLLGFRERTGSQNDDSTVGFFNPLLTVDSGGEECAGEPVDLQIAGGACGAPDAPEETAGCVLASLDNDSRDGHSPEVITLRREVPNTQLPEALSYFYRFRINAAGDTVLHYPAGVAAYVVNSEASAADVAAARVEVFEGNTSVGRFSYPGTIDQDARPTWIALLIEYGYRRPDPQGPQDVYFRVLPFEGLDQNAWTPTTVIEAPGLEGGEPVRWAAVVDDRLMVNLGDRMLEQRAGAAGWSAVMEDAEDTWVIGASGADLVVQGSLVASALGGEPIDCVDPITDALDLGTTNGPRQFLITTSAGVRLLTLADGTCLPALGSLSCDEAASCLDGCGGDCDTCSALDAQGAELASAVDDCRVDTNCQSGGTCDVDCSVELAACAGHSPVAPPGGAREATMLGRDSTAGFMVVADDGLYAGSPSGDGQRVIWSRGLPTDDAVAPDALERAGATLATLLSIDGELWAGTDRGLFRWDGFSDDWSQLQDCGGEGFDEFEPCFPREGTGATVTAMARLGRSIYVASGDGLMALPASGTGGESLPVPNFPAGEVEVLALLPFDGALYVLTADHGLLMVGGSR